MATELVIANEALILLGEGLITSGQLAAPDDKKSRLVVNLLTMARKAMLRDCQPNCSKAYADLVTAGVQLHPDHGYVYALPTDCLRVVAAYSGLSSSPAYGGPRPVISRWKVITGNEIALDEEEACIEYVKDVATTAFDPLTDTALAAYLAWKMALPLTESTSKREQMAQAYADAKRNLENEKEGEGQVEQFRDGGRLLQARHGYGYGSC